MAVREERKFSSEWNSERRVAVPDFGEIISNYSASMMLFIYIVISLRMAEIIIAEDNTQKITKIISAKNGRGALYLGNQKAASDPKLLKSYGIKAVITIAKELPNHYNELQHLKIEVEDQPLAYIYPYFDKSYSFLSKNLAEGNVFVHCKMGISRSASLVIAYIMRKYKCSYEKAFTQVKKKRALINPNQGFILQLKEYDKNLKKLQ